MIKHIWFFNDDFQWIWASATTSFNEIFLSPERYRTMGSFLTPLLGVSFKIDWTLFGMNPVGYYIHNLISLFAAAAAFYLFLRLYATKIVALTGVLLFLLNPITFSIITWFADRQYIEGFFWALRSLDTFVKSERAGKASIPAGIFYLFASLNKETYVILPAIAFLLSKEGLLKRLKNTVPLLLVLVIYIPYRYWMMGGTGGYIDIQPISPSTVISLFSKMIDFVSLDAFKNYSSFFYILILAAFIFSVKSIKLSLIGKSFIVLLILIIPIIPVSNRISGRYLFHLSVFLICIFCLLMEYSTFKNALLKKGIIFFIGLITFIVFIKHDIQLFDSVKQERIEAKEAATRFISAREPYVKLNLFVGFYEPLRKIFREFFGRDIKTELVPAENALKYCNPEKLREIKDSGIEIPYEQILGFQERLKNGPISVSMILSHYKVTWYFVPQKDVSYSILAGRMSGLYHSLVSIKPSGTLMLNKDPKDGKQNIFYIRICYRAHNEGVEVISPEFMLTIPGNQRIEYTRTD